jgi:phosphoribosylaminoimidazole-succinocarboxamide synthase
MANQSEIIIREGSVYTLYQHGENQVRFHDRGMISAADGERYEHIPGLAPLRMRQTVLAMNYLKNAGLPVAFERAEGTEGMICPLVKMIPLEVVVRRALIGSYLKRHPEQEPAWLLLTPVIEFFHKQTYDTRVGRLVDGNELRKLGAAEIKRLKKAKLIFPDPFIFPKDDAWNLYDAQASLSTQKVLARISPEFGNAGEKNILSLAHSAFSLLKEAFNRVDGLKLGVADDCEVVALADIKFEFGVNEYGQLVLADVVNLDSMRLIVNGDLGPNMRHISKQKFRDGGTAADVLKVYEQGTKAFELAFAS